MHGAGGVKSAAASEDPKGHLSSGGGLGASRPLKFTGHTPSSEHMAVEGEAPLAAIGGAVADMEGGAGGGGNLSARRPLLPR